MTGCTAYSISSSEAVYLKGIKDGTDDTRENISWCREDYTIELAISLLDWNLLFYLLWLLQMFQLDIGAYIYLSQTH